VRFAALLLCACSYTAHPPLLNGCPRVEVEAYTAGALECVLLEDTNGLTLFRLESSESCGGPACLRLDPGQTGYALEKIRPGPEAEWSVLQDACAEVPRCP
jgi:hypothetical protein